MGPLNAGGYDGPTWSIASTSVRIAGTLNNQCYISEVLEPVVLPYLQGLATAIFQQDNARPHVARVVQRFFVSSITRLNCFPGRLALRIFRR
ncbi:hypothetical protein TNCV_3990931 [Trichonephila clavipes]|uniref:Transposase n=1 Tax=Trichonephila clavipes TaxID=2585209 RepID=A0A8X6VP35_TRICX|nr:hypothetical protein TNCV_3990931 [Trichonephila clavipes]